MREGPLELLGLPDKQEVQGKRVSKETQELMELLAIRGLPVTGGLLDRVAGPQELQDQLVQRDHSGVHLVRLGQLVLQARKEQLEAPVREELLATLEVQVLKVIEENQALWG